MLLGVGWCILTAGQPPLCTCSSVGCPLPTFAPILLPSAHRNPILLPTPAPAPERSKDSRFKRISCEYVHFGTTITHNANAVRNSHVMVGPHGGWVCGRVGGWVGG